MNEYQCQDIEEAIGNMDAGLNLMDTFDDFESLDDEEEIKEEDEDTVGGGSTVPPPLPFEIDDDLDEHERRLMDDIVVPVYAVGVKIIARLAKMRKNYNVRYPLDYGSYRLSYRIPGGSGVLERVRHTS